MQNQTLRITTGYLAATGNGNGNGNGLYQREQGILLILMTNTNVLVIKMSKIKVWSLIVKTNLLSVFNFFYTKYTYFMKINCEKPIFEEMYETLNDSMW